MLSYGVLYLVFPTSLYHHKWSWASLCRAKGSRSPHHWQSEIAGSAFFFFYQIITHWRASGATKTTRYGIDNLPRMWSPSVRHRRDVSALRQDIQQANRQKQCKRPKSNVLSVNWSRSLCKFTPFLHTRKSIVYFRFAWYCWRCPRHLPYLKRVEIKKATDQPITSISTAQKSWFHHRGQLIFCYLCRWFALMYVKARVTHLSGIFLNRYITRYCKML